VGCALETDTGRSLGTVRDVIHTAANDVWSAVAEDGKETLVPVLRDVIVDVDLDAKRIVVREIPGLTMPG
jgi:16S rRNA processing protein RimM